MRGVFVVRVYKTVVSTNDENEIDLNNNNDFDFARL